MKFDIAAVERNFSAVVGVDGSIVVQGGETFVRAEWWAGEPHQSRLLLSVRVEAELASDQNPDKLIQGIDALYDEIH